MRNVKIFILIIFQIKKSSKGYKNREREREKNYKLNELIGGCFKESALSEGKEGNV